MLRSIIYIFALTIGLSHQLKAAPEYDQSPEDLKWVMAKLKEWLPGEWSAFPQVHYERTTRMPQEGEHENWYRTFALIDAPQVGDTVFYGQVNMDGRNGYLLARSQITYEVYIDEARGAVVMNGQPPAESDRFIDLQDNPELWRELPDVDQSKLNCDFLWRRDGDQLFAVLEGKTPDRQTYGPGTCNYFSEAGQAEFFADAEWVLTPETLWIYDINTMGGQLFIGREDKTHVRLSRARPYTCDVTDAKGQRSLNANDRGFETGVTAGDGSKLKLMLLRAEYPAEERGWDDRLRLSVTDPRSESVIATKEADPLKDISLEVNGATASCKRVSRFPPRADAD